MMIMFSGAGMRRFKPPGRMPKRDLDTVGADYEPDLIECREGYWAQYGAATVALWVIFAGLVTLVIVQPVFLALTWVTILAMPFCLLLPMRWIYTYRRQRAIFNGIDEPAKPSRVEKVMS